MSHKPCRSETIALLLYIVTKQDNNILSTVREIYICIYVTNERAREKRKRQKDVR